MGKGSGAEGSPPCDLPSALSFSSPRYPFKKAEQGKISWDVVKTLVAINRKERPHYSECYISKEKRGIPPLENVYGIIADEIPASGF